MITEKLNTVIHDSATDKAKMSIKNLSLFCQIRKNGISKCQHNLKNITDMVFSVYLFYFSAIKKDHIPSDICGM